MNKKAVHSNYKYVLDWPFFYILSTTIQQNMRYENKFANFSV